MSAPRMHVTVLGSGTSTGVPIIGCRCPVCTSSDPRDARLRCGFHVEAGGFGLQIDVSPDFRAQALRFAIGRVDALVVTHCHADHVLGLDDVRRFNTLQESSIPVFARPAELRRIRRIFGYIFHPSAGARRAHLYIPRLEPRELGRDPVRIGPFLVRAIPIPHGPAKATALEVSLGAKRAVFASDCSLVSPALAAMLRGADLAFLDGLRDRP
ncbi:MAG: MBL fold metallo-hydrolase, partial [Kiritimatiellae bacterium]|nr:MBL fold metallo-hydrolase [Kiritimatiellia bacterium]